MENIIKNPGLQIIMENIFHNLDLEKLEICRFINDSCKQMLDDPMFWLREFIQRGISKKNQNSWIKAIQITKNTELEKHVLSYLKRSRKKESVVDLHCFKNEDFLEKIENIKEEYLKKADNFQKYKCYPKFSLRNWKSYPKFWLRKWKKNDPNAPDEYEGTQIFWFWFFELNMISFFLEISPLVEIISKFYM